MYSLTFPAGEDSADAQTLAANADVASVTPDLSRDTATAPNDPRYSDQWSLPQIGWDNVFGSVDPGSGATVAVLDTGVDASQPDLQGAVVPGTDIVDGSGDGTSDPNGHGTEMAGIVAASTDNNVGIAGVGYSGVKVMPVTVLGADGTGLDSDVINGVVWATQHGANVILMSFSNPGYSPALQAAVNYAWSHGVVLVAAVGNDGSSTINYPAGDTGVVGVGSTGIGDAPSMFSNTGPDVFLAAPGEDILTTDTSGGYSSISGTSASAAEVAGAAALLKANSPMAGNGVIVNRLAESADAAGTPDQTGNGRLNLERAISDTNAASTEPAGAPGGGPFVGPYTIAAQLSGQLQTQNNPACSSGGICPWQTTNPTGWGELQTVPLRLLFAAGQSGLSNSFSISVDHSDGRTQGLDGLTNWSTSCSLSGITISGGVPTNGVTFASSTNGSGATTWTYTFTVTDNSSTACEIDFFTQLLAGSHQFTGTSLQIKGAGTIGFTKPTAAGGTADLSITKTALTAVSPGQVLTYNVAYSNGGTSTASGTQVTDVLPAGVTLVPASCSGTCSYDPLSREISWPIGTLASGGSGTKTYQVTVNPSDTDGTQLINNARIDSAVQDPNINNNQSQVTTTVKVPSISGSVIDDGTSGGLAGASVRLFTTTNCSGGSQVGSVITTDATGNWSFSGTGVTINTAYHVLRSNPTGYTSTSAVAGTGNLSSAVAQGNDCIQVTLGATGTYSSNNEFHASGVQNTTTAVTCTPSTVTYGGNTSCTATVTGATTGTISWSTDGSGSFSNSGTCSLSAGSCSITYTPNSVGTGTHKVTATYPSDSTHNGSNGSANVTVNPASLTVTPDSGQSKVYGTNDPTLTYTHGTLYNNDTNSVFSGSLTRDTGET
ncbi:MAG TPA: S8 family serine peptidase, partial [Gaiellaceae bacterium]|nr:S8 family serine peptidase [Gaiellaceae bacterium]